MSDNALNVAQTLKELNSSTGETGPKRFMPELLCQSSRVASQAELPVKANRQLTAAMTQLCKCSLQVIQQPFIAQLK